MREAAKRFKALGASVEEVSVPITSLRQQSGRRLRSKDCRRR